MSQKAKKPVAVLAISISMTETMEKLELELEQIPCIGYLVIFKNQTKAIMNSESEINLMSQVFAFQLGFKVQKTNVEAQKIDKHYSKDL